MKCPICTAPSFVAHTLRFDREHRVEHARVCDLGHRFKTCEVHPTQLADRREMACAIRNIDRRIAKFQRDAAIAADPRPAKMIAHDHNITDARVRQIRASFQSKNAVEWAAKILTHNSERKRK